MNSPLGQYAPVVAAATCGGVIAVYLAALLFSRSLGIGIGEIQALHDLAILAFGAVVGSAVAVNGWKQPVAAAHDRIDEIELSTGIHTHSGPDTVPDA